ncbi:prephenate dehydrogenase [Streptomyces sp. 8N706]|uniref:prephenate dehydrogenase n=1 Tax=Streptomyces sp. 8N706 TaxID=3457416 RepID=UPI003FD2E26E
MRTAAIVGTGLIGTSIALALSARGVTTHLLDRDPRTVRTAAARGAGTPDSPSEPVDIAILAVPPLHTAAALAEQQARKLATVYTDVASVKGLPSARIRELGCDATTMVGGHPLAGRERSGPLAARADLFQDRPWVLTPGPETSEAALNRALELVALCGAVPVLLDAHAHDRAVALVSHLPHLMASLTAARLLDGEDYAVRLAGRGAQDVTRIAAGDADLWADILAANAAAISEPLAQLVADLATTADALRRLADGDPAHRDGALADLAEMLRRGGAGHARIAARRSGAWTALSVSVPAGDQDGQVARLLDDIGETQVELEDMVFPETTGRRGDAVRLMVLPTAARPLTDALRSRGWAVRC